VSQNHFTLAFPSISTIHYSRFAVLSEKTLLFLGDFAGEFAVACARVPTTKNIKHLTKKSDMLVPLLGIALVDPGVMNITIGCYQPRSPFLDGSYKVPRLKMVQ
jgi:hypothetical protein